MIKMTCARCGCGVFKAEDQIIMNKVWHKCCFRCSRCNKVLDKCTAKLFQGEIYCECCHVIVVEDFETLLKPCRVVSSPSCICIKRESQYMSKTPSFDYSKKYDICFPSELKHNLSRNIQSCSCIPDVKNKTYCFAFPMPREVANYYNRSGMRKKNRSQKRHSNDDNQDCSQKTTNFKPSIRIRTLTPPRKRCSPSRTRSPREESPQRSPQGYHCCPKYNSCSCNKCTECPVLLSCPVPCEKSEPCCSCRKCRDFRCNECEVKPRFPSPSRRCCSPRIKSPYCFHRCSEACESNECPERPQHSPRSLFSHHHECSHQTERSHCDRPCCPVERPHHPESPPCIQERLCYKCCNETCTECPPSCKECPPSCKECPPSCKECPRSCKECPRSCAECPRSHKECNRGCKERSRICKECPLSCDECPRSCNDCPRNCKECPPPNQCSCCPHATKIYSCRYKKHGKSCRCDKTKKYCACGKPSPCDCKMNQIKSECTTVCVRCGCKVYAAEKICVSSGSYHTSCFSCVCCHKLLDIKNVYENGGEIYCKHCYNNLMGNSYYGYA